MTKKILFSTELKTDTTYMLLYLKFIGQDILFIFACMSSYTKWVGGQRPNDTLTPTPYRNTTSG